MKTLEIRHEGKLLGWIARVGAVDGVWTEYTPSGFKIQRYKGSEPMMPLRAFFEPTIYNTRGEAKRALFSTIHNVNSQSLQG